MGRTKNPHRIEGSFGGITIYYNKLLDEYLVRTPGGMPKEKFDTLPSCEAVRKNAKAFGDAAVYCGHFRDAVASIVRGVCDPKLHWRLGTLFNAMVRSSIAANATIESSFPMLHETVLNKFNSAFTISLVSSHFSKTKGAEIIVRTRFDLYGLPNYTYCTVKGLLRRIDVAGGSYEKGSHTTMHTEVTDNFAVKEITLRFNRTMSKGNLFLIVSLQFYEIVNRKKSYVTDRRMYGGMIFYLDETTPRPSP